MTDDLLPDTFFHTRDNPWYGCGTKLYAPATVDEALAKSGLDWDVEMRPMEFRSTFGDGSYKRIKNRYVTVRADNEAVLGQVGPNYRIWNNRDAFAFADNLVDEGLQFDAAGSYRGQRRVFLVAKLPDVVQVLGEDPYELYLVLLTSHDGTMAITAIVTHLRMRCTNMVPMMLREAKTRWTVRHTATAEGRIVEAREALALTFKADGAFQAAMEGLAAEELSDTQFRAVLETVLPARPTRDENVAAILAVRYESPNLDGFRRSRYGALHAFSEWMDWGRQVRSEEARFQVSFEGYGAKQRNRLYQMLAMS